MNPCKSGVPCGADYRPVPVQRGGRRKTPVLPVGAWMVDAMERVYPDRVPEPDPGAASLHAVAGGCAALVVAVRAPEAGEVTLRFEGYAGETDWPAPAVHTLRPVRVRANTVRICRPGRWSEEQAPHLLRRAPFSVHEAIWPGQTVATPGACTEAFLLLFMLPDDGAPGEHPFRVRVTGASLDETLTGALRVHGAALPRPQRLKVTNWLRLDRLLHPYPDVTPWSERHWEFIARALAVLRAGGQNVILLPYCEPAGNLVDVHHDADGGYRFGFERLDRFVTMALEMGYQYLEGGHLAGKKDRNGGPQKDLRDQHLYLQVPAAGGMARGPQIPVESAEGRAFLAAFLPALRAHLAARGWLDRYCQHIADEPFRPVAESFVRLTEEVRALWPGVRLIDAASVHAGALALDIPVPELDYLEPYRDFYRSLAARGKEVWFYVCCCPIGAWPNRFLDFHLNKGGLLPWFNFHYGAPGFLHWGAAQWPKEGDIYENPGFQGDGWILCPGPDGPIASMRWLALRLGVEDHELLTALAERGPAGEARAREICAGLITDATHYRHDTATVRAARARLRREAAAIE